MRCFARVVSLLVFFSWSFGHKVYDFEQDSELNEFIAEGGSAISLASGISKSGVKSLLWSWDEKDRGPIKLKLGIKQTISNYEVFRGGVRFWMYREPDLPDAVMKLRFSGPKLNITAGSLDRKRRELKKRFLWHQIGVTGHQAQAPSSLPTMPQQPTSTNPPLPTTQPTVNPPPTPAPDPVDATVHLNFEGFRGVWIKYSEMALIGLADLDQLEFEIESPVTQGNHVYFDLLRLVKKQSRHTRDLVVPPMGVQTPDLNSHWQQSYRWWMTYPPPAYHHSNQAGLIREIDMIEERLHNWFADEKRSSYDKVYDEEFDDFRKARWSSLMSYIDEAQGKYENLTFSADGRKITRPSLFGKNSEYGKGPIQKGPNAKLKFGIIMKEILLPLSLEYHLKSRDVQVKAAAKAECDLLASSDLTEQDKGIMSIAGANPFMAKYFKQALPSQINCNDSGKEVIPAITKLNTLRLQRVMKVLEYVTEQGWTCGSGIGSLDHQMNRNGAGYMNSLFLLREHLRKPENAKLLERYIKSMKWYNDYNEIYQEDRDYAYDGSTADRIRTILAFRLFTILMIPNSRAAEKIRDLFYLKKWAEHALKVNKGMGGLIKPDYTGFHHKAFYGSAYVPIAYHNAAFVAYLLSGTSFDLGPEARGNLRKGLEVMRMVSVKYSSPHGICGRFPNYTKSILAVTLPMYAYIAYEPANAYGVKGAEMFLRLYDKNNPNVKEYLSAGQILTGIFYLNSLGSLGVLQKVKALALQAGEKPEPSPNGHWSKTFGSINIHRRRDWAVAVKGMNNYVWDYEMSSIENRFGLFQSHGSLQISNSEESLSSYDVDNGWSWNHIPGATSANIEPANMVAARGRWFNPMDFGGGSTIKGTAGKTPQNGIFGMEFTKPNYFVRKTTLLKYMTFSFKKSFFFMDHLIVAIGSNIKLGNISSQYHPLTTLFQDKMVDLNGARGHIVVDGIHHSLDKDLPDRTSWTTGDGASTPKSSVELIDTNGNIYHIPNPDAQGLHVRVQEQRSKLDSGREDTKARYALSWLQHQRSGADFNYAIVIDGGNRTLLTQYFIKQQDATAHIVQFTDLPTPRSNTFGYVFFKSDVDVNPGPVTRVSSPCTLMTEETGDELHIALSNPRFILVRDEDKKHSPACEVVGGAVRRDDGGEGAEYFDEVSYDEEDVDDDEGEEGGGIFGPEASYLNDNKEGFSEKLNELRERLIGHKAPHGSENSGKSYNSRSRAREFRGMSEDRIGQWGGDKEKEHTISKRSRGLYPFKNSNDIKSDYQYCRKSDEVDIAVTLRSPIRVEEISNVLVDGKGVEKADRHKFVRIEDGGRRVRFRKLANGFTTEVELELED